MWTERTIVNDMISGVLQGPVEFSGICLAPLLVSPTGCRFDGESYVYRDPSTWLSERMTERMAGVPLLGGADGDGPVSGSAVIKRMIGVCMQGYIKGTELWCVARIANDFAWRLIKAGAAETRVSVAFDELPSIDIDEGNLIVEPAPRYMNHLCLVPLGSDEFEFGFSVQSIDSSDSAKESSYAYA